MVASHLVVETERHPSSLPDYAGQEVGQASSLTGPKSQAESLTYGWPMTKAACQFH
jgi:hypothetical protein